MSIAKVTGSQIDDDAASAGVYPDNRSNRGGSEPEGIDLTHERGYDLAAVSLDLSVLEVRFQ
jgi:hypothetical protein